MQDRTIPPRGIGLVRSGCIQMGFLWLPRWRMWVLGCKGRRLQDIQKKIQYQDFYGIIRFKSSGRGGSASGRATDFCPSRPGSNPRLTLGFFWQNLSLFLLGVRLFLLEWIIERWQCLTLLFFPVSHHHQLTLGQSIVINALKKTKNQKGPGKVHIKNDSNLNLSTSGR